MKSHKFSQVCLAILVIATLGAKNAAMVSSANASVTKVVEEKTARTIDCRNANDYRFVVVENPGRKLLPDPVTPEDLNIVGGDKVISKIELPKESEFKNFSLKSTEKNKAGFEIKVDWGDGVYHYEIEFNFKCKENNFFLYKVKKDSFSTKQPDSGNFLDKKKSKVTKIKPNVPIEKFVMINYL